MIRSRVGPPGAASAALVLATVMALLSGCSTYADRNLALRDDLARGEFDAALLVVTEAERDSDRLLNLLERGLILHYANRWEESNAVFEEAEALSDDLYTRSVSRAVASMLTNEGAVEYRAAPFEMALVPYFRAMNYIELGERDEALVEARKAELRLRDLADMDAALRGDNEASTVSVEDHAFIHYLRGMLHEWGGETNDAFLAYRRAAVSYREAAGRLDAAMPPWLGADLLRTGLALGFRDELAEFENAYPGLLPDTTDVDADLGRVVLFLETGWTPHLVSVAADVPIFSDEEGDSAELWAVDLRGRYVRGWNSDADIEGWIRFALPEILETPSTVTGARISAGTLAGNAVTHRVEDVAGRAHLRFEDRMPGVILRAIARAVTKYLAKEQIGKKGELAGLLANLVGVATEQADTRCWLTLPQGIAMARLDLPTGVHDLRVELVDAAGRTVAVETVEGVAVRRGGWTFLSRRTF